MVTRLNSCSATQLKRNNPSQPPPKGCPLRSRDKAGSPARVRPRSSLPAHGPSSSPPDQARLTVLRGSPKAGSQRTVRQELEGPAEQVGVLRMAVALSGDPRAQAPAAAECIDPEKLHQQLLTTAATTPACPFRSATGGLRRSVQAVRAPVSDRYR